MLRAKLKQTFTLVGFAFALHFASAQAQTVTETILHNFVSVPASGANPYAGVTFDSAGNLYGTTVYGGTANDGVIYKINTSNQQTVLYSFLGGSDGSQPIGSVTFDAAGNLYGTALYGGSGHSGVVFKFNTTTNQETVLYTFKGGSDGGRPGGGVILDSAGNLYGTAAANGSLGFGVVFKVSPAGQESVLYNFTGAADGAIPDSGLVVDSQGNLYGTTLYGGAGFAGTVYKLNPAGQETVLYSFLDGADGGMPYGGVVMDATGNLYGTTNSGGPANAGVVYKIDSSGQEIVLYSFTGGGDGGSPYSGVTLDSLGNLYGATYAGGSSNAGVVYKVTQLGRETVLYSFTGGADGDLPYSTVTLDGAGDIYGTTSGNAGVVYKVNEAGQETVVYGFAGGVGGSAPQAGVIMDSSGNLYGTATNGGTGGDGVVYKLSNTQQETVLFGFPGGVDGSDPLSGLARDPSGNFYGTTVAGGASGKGLVYKISSGRETVLYNFSGQADGSQPYAGVILDSSNNAYGTTPHGGQFGYGVVYEVSPTGQETVLYNFTGWGDGAEPYSGLSRDSAGNFYGTTLYGGFFGHGVVYKLSPTGQETVLYSFFGGEDGNMPYSGVILDSGSNVYGTTEEGGEFGEGAVYKVTPGGQEFVLYNFTGGSDGDFPQSGLVRDSSGNLYGTTHYGGKAGWGVVFKLTSSGKETVLHSFTGGTDGGEPFGNLLLDSSNNIYGTTIVGGTADSGVLYKLAQ
jgi:uncharacterized repeat protein (TIGR03803 family)